MKISITGIFAEYLNAYVYDAICIKTDDGREIYINEILHDLFAKDSHLKITIEEVGEK